MFGNMHVKGEIPISNSWGARRILKSLFSCQLNLFHELTDRNLHKIICNIWYSYNYMGLIKVWNKSKPLLICKPASLRILGMWNGEVEVESTRVQFFCTVIIKSLLTNALCTSSNSWMSSQIDILLFIFLLLPLSVFCPSSSQCRPPNNRHILPGVVIGGCVGFNVQTIILKPH